jgi:D-alanine transaminase
MSEIYLNGRFVAPDKATISVMDRGFLFGDGVYEVIPAYHGYTLRADEHLDRLDHSLNGIRMTNPLARADWHGIFTRLLSGIPAPRQAVYVQVTRGAPPVRDHRFGGEPPAPTVLAMAKTVPPRDQALAERGIAAIVRDDPRWRRCDLKVVSLVAAVLLQQDAADAEAVEAILIRDGLAVEASTSNLFIVRDGRILTPPKDWRLLPGITRDLVLDLARDAGLPFDEADIPAATLTRADEVWITSSTREVMPVTRIDDTIIGDGRPGPLWRRMDGLYQAYKAQLAAGAING